MLVHIRNMAVTVSLLSRRGVAQCPPHPPPTIRHRMQGKVPRVTELYITHFVEYGLHSRRGV